MVGEVEAGKFLHPCIFQKQILKTLKYRVSQFVVQKLHGQLPSVEVACIAFLFRCNGFSIEYLIDDVKTRVALELEVCWDGKWERGGGAGGWMGFPPHPKSPAACSSTARNGHTTWFDCCQCLQLNSYSLYVHNSVKLAKQWQKLTCLMALLCSATYSTGQILEETETDRMRLLLASSRFSAGSRNRQSMDSIWLRAMLISVNVAGNGWWEMSLSRLLEIVKRFKWVGLKCSCVSAWWLSGGNVGGVGMCRIFIESNAKWLVRASDGISEASCGCVKLNWSWVRTAESSPTEIISASVDIRCKCSTMETGEKYEAIKRCDVSRLFSSVDSGRLMDR